MFDRVPTFVTFVMLTYNQRDYIVEAVKSALSQTYSPLEIIISDDASSDGTYEEITTYVECHPSPHRIILRRNNKNIGIANHINKVLSLARGEIIVLAAGDDISAPERVEIIVNTFHHSRASLVHSDVTYINREGIEILNFSNKTNLTLINSNNRFAVATSLSLYVGATGAIHRDIIDVFGPICFDQAYEDLVYGYRAVLLNGAAYIDTKLVKYRIDVGISNYATTLVNPLARRMAQIRSLTASLQSLQQRLADTRFRAPQQKDLILCILIKIHATRIRIAIMTGSIINVARTLITSPMMSGLALVVWGIRRLRP